mgnify:FL=1
MFKKVFGLFGFGCDETKVQVEALLQEVALLKEDLENLSTKVTDHVEEAEEVEVDYDTLVDNLSYSDLANNIDTSDLAREIDVDYEDLASNVDMDQIVESLDKDEIVEKVFEKLMEKLKGVCNE